MTRVVFFGDSICFGQGVSIHQGWVTRLSARLELLGEDLSKSLIVQNSGINGDTTRLALERMPYDVQSNGVDILIIQFGMNDCNHWVSDKGAPRVSPAAFEANLQEIIDRARLHGARHIILNTNHPTLRNKEKMTGSDCTYQENNRRYNAKIRDVFARNRETVVLNDMEQIFDDEVGSDQSGLAKFLLVDHLHLSRAGHDVYFSHTWPIVEQVTRSLFSDAV